MKSIRLHILLLLAAASHVGLMAQSTKAWVREEDLSTITPTSPTAQWILVYLPSDLGGAYVPVFPVSTKGNRYELWAKGTAWDTKSYLLDTKLIRAYSPAALFSIDTGDDYIRGNVASGQFVMRTRADQPYTMQIKIGGLVEGSANAAEGSVYLGINGTNYDPDTYSAIGPKAGEEEELDHKTIDKNGTIPLGPYLHSLNTPLITKAVGEMKFTVVRYAADGVPDTIIAEPKIEVWPVAEAKFTGVTDNQVFIDAIPEVVFTYKDLYPDSRTYVQIYSGPQKNDTVGTIVDTTELKFGKHYNPGLPTPIEVPQNASIGVTGLSSYTPKDGIYTMEIITETPFGGRAPILLKHVTFEVDRVISSRGKLSTAEGATTSP